MSAADKLAQVLAEHSRTAWNRGDDDKVTGIVCAECQHVYEEWPPNRSTVCAHVAAVVLAHLTAEGWAQGREDQWGVKFTHPADQRVSIATTREHADLMLEGLREHYGPHVDLAVVRRYVTEWEPVEGEQS